MIVDGMTVEEIIKEFDKVKIKDKFRKLLETNINKIRRNCIKTKNYTVKINFRTFTDKETGIVFIYGGSFHIEFLKNYHIKFIPIDGIISAIITNKKGKREIIIPKNSYKQVDDQIKKIHNSVQIIESHAIKRFKERYMKIGLDENVDFIEIVKKLLEVATNSLSRKSEYNGKPSIEIRVDGGTFLGIPDSKDPERIKRIITYISDDELFDDQINIIEMKDFKDNELKEELEDVEFCKFISSLK